MATSVDNLIANAKSYANAALGDADIIMSRIADAMPVVNNRLAYLVDNKSAWDYTDIGSWADNMYDAVRSDDPDTLDPDILTSIGEFTAFKPLTYPSSVRDLAYVRDTLLNTIEELLELPDRFSEASRAFDVLNTYITAGVAGAISPSASEILAGGEARQERVSSEILGIPLIKFPGSTSAGSGYAALDSAVGRTQIRDVVIHKTLDLQRKASASWLKIALESATAQSGLNKEKYSTLIATVDAILEFGKAEVEEGDIEFKINDLKFRKDEAYSKVLNTLRATHMQRWTAQFGIATTAYSVLQQANVDQLQKDKTVIAGSLERVQAQLEEFKYESGVRSKALAGTSAIMAQKVAGALSSLNTLVGQIEELTAD